MVYKSQLSLFFCYYFFVLFWYISLLSWCPARVIQIYIRNWGQEKKGTTEDKMAGWHHWLNGREFQWTPGAGDGQGGLMCRDSWDRKQSDTTERLNWTELSVTYILMKPKTFCQVKEDKHKILHIYSMYWSANL